MSAAELKDKIKELRKKSGLTMRQLADAVNVSEATISRWESGNIPNMRRDKIYDLAKALNTTPAYLMGWVNEDKKLCDIKLPNGNIFEFKENNGKIKIMMKKSNKSEWQEFKFDEYEQKKIEKIIDMNMSFFNVNKITLEDKMELEKALFTIFIKVNFNDKK